jgi:hypothetical protein
MKGAVKKNIFPRTGDRDERLAVAASPVLGADELLIRLWRCRRFIITLECLQKLKSMTDGA